MRDVFVAALVEPFHQIRARFRHSRIDVVRRWQIVRVQQIEIRQDANAIAVLPPSIVALRLRRILHGAVATQSRAEGKMLDVIAQSEGDPPTIWPLIHRPLVDRAVAAPVVMRKLHAILLAMRQASHRAWRLATDSRLRTGTGHGMDACVRWGKN